MKPERQKKPSKLSATTGGYGELFAAIKEHVSKAQVRAHAAVCRELNLLYWQIGRDIVERQKREGWGRSVIEKLASDIQATFPGIEGFSANNVWRMRAFYLAFEAESPILAQPAQEIRAGHPSPILAQPATDLPPLEILSIPWFHNVILIQKVKDPATFRRSIIQTDLDQPNRRLSTSSFFLHPSNFRTSLWFLAKIKNANAKRGCHERCQRIDLALATRLSSTENKA